jgi:hypothetical protein
VIAGLGNEIVAILQNIALSGHVMADYFLEELDSKSIWTQLGIIVACLQVIFSFPPMLEPMRLSALYLVNIREEYPTFFWVTIGLIWLLIAAVMATIATTYQDYALITATPMAMVMQFVAPAVMLIKCMPELPKIHWVGVYAYAIGGSILAVAGIALQLM